VQTMLSKTGVSAVLMAFSLQAASVPAIEGVSNGVSNSFRFDLHNYGDFSRAQKDLHMEWSPTGSNLCLWWNEGSSARGKPTRWLVFTTNGVLLSSWTNAIFDPRGSPMDFPAIRPWLKWSQYLTNASAVTSDERESHLFCSTFSAGGIFSSTRVESIRLDPAGKQLWAQDFSESGSVQQMKVVGEGGKDLFVGFSGVAAKLLDTATGRVRHSFTYGHIEDDAEALGRRKRFGLRIPASDVSLRFYCGVLAVDAQNRRVAAGSFYDRRVRVISLLPPFPQVFEANANESPAITPGGAWRVYWMDFVASGSDLVVEYHFSASPPGSPRRRTEIFETGTWQRVWQTDAPDVHSVTVSSDGKSMALVRNNAVEIVPFGPVK